MAREENLQQEIKQHLENLAAENSSEQVTIALKNLAPLMARLDPLDTERHLEDIKKLLGKERKPMLNAFQKKIKALREEIKKAPLNQSQNVNLSPEEELKILHPLAEHLAICPDILGEVVRVLTRLGLAGGKRSQDHLPGPDLSNI